MGSSRRSGAWRPVDGILVLDKPSGPSSNAALQQARRLFAAAKAGHTGSLDPLASGLLPILFGEATKLGGFLLEADKSYQARVTLGARTTTGDAEGAVIERSDPSRCSAELLEAACERFKGAIEQIPPMFSAIKLGGMPLYRLAREGQQVDREPRAVMIHELRVTGFHGDGFDLQVRCSKGTYIRTLAEDLAAAVGQCAHLGALRRTGCQPFEASQMVTLEALEQAARNSSEALDRFLLPPLSALPDWRRCVAEPWVAERLGHGAVVEPGLDLAPGPVAVVDAGGRMLGLAEVDTQGRWVPKRWLRPVSERT